jgi:D-lactate dehydrogenase
MLDHCYLALYRELRKTIPATRLIHDDLRTLTYGTDASLYRMIPKIVVQAETEEEIIAILQACRRFRTSVTFRAAGTSLSGQALSDSVLVYLARGWKNWEILEDGHLVRLQPGVVGAHINCQLAPYNRKIGPDPASINSAMIGGIAANNASGMCCGTAQNSYQTVRGMRIIFADGSRLDTTDPQSHQQFLSGRADLVSQLDQLARQTRANTELASRIRRKFKIKNTTGYSLNALVDFEDPIDILQHLMIGSEGTLGFIAGITYETVPEQPAKATALIFFPDIQTACEATTELKDCPVSAVEIMDRAALRSVEDKPGMPALLRSLPMLAAALLVESRADEAEGLEQQVAEIQRRLSPLPVLSPITFTSKPAEYYQLWNIRKGLFPSVGAMRNTGSTVIIEDVAFPIDRLASATLDLQGLFEKRGYSGAIIFGHALEGNLHFVITPDFNQPEEVRRYRDFMEDLTGLVVQGYDGSLKAEHGTGRNMAPFVEKEWGSEAFHLMKEIKRIFDPENLLNPGVIINSSPVAHLQNLKPLHRAHEIVDKCMECGFCEINCPSRDLSLTPRQRIVAAREISRLKEAGENPAQLQDLLTLFAYQGNATCATDGLCATSCPVGIDTGKFIKEWRWEGNPPWAQHLATWVAGHMGRVTAGMRFMLSLVNRMHVLVGGALLGTMAKTARKLSGSRLPQWNPWLPKGAEDSACTKTPGSTKVVYLPSCISRTMGISRDAPFSDSQNQRIITVLEKAGMQVILPGNLDNLCCGMAFSSKGFFEQGEQKLKELITALMAASNEGRYPVLLDTSPCFYRMKDSGLIPAALQLFEPVEFALTFLTERLEFHPLPGPVALHPTCSSRKLGLEGKLKQLGELCAQQVIIPENIGCCGFAGDRGFSYPELNQSALKDLKASLPQDCRVGFSTSRTCEIGLSEHSGISYQSIYYLLDEATTPVNQSSNQE